ncbi:MAG: Gfo/Idh/MocA family oxidoreductase [Phycisphaerales bacterium]
MPTPHKNRPSSLADSPSRLVTRRDFVRTSAGAAAGLATLSLPAAAARVARTAYAAGSDTIKVGLVGCGGRGTGAAAQALTADAGCRLWAAADIMPGRIASALGNVASEMGDEAAAKIDCPDDRRFVGLDAYRRVIDSGVDLVVLATPPAFRPEQFRYAVQAGKHCFVEKPMATDAPGVRSVIESARMAKDRGLAVVAGFCWRYADAEKATYQEILSGRIGEVRAMYTTYNAGGFPAPTPRQPEWSDLEFQLRNWHYYTWLSGDHIVEQAVHAIDWINWAFGDRPPLRATAVGGRQVRTAPEYGHIYDHFSVTYEYDGGAKAFHMCRHWPNCSNDNTASIIGSAGHAFVNGWGPVHRIEPVGEPVWQYRGPRGSMYQNEHNALMASIRAGEPINDGDWMARSTLMAIMGRKAAYTGQTVTWEQMLADDEALVPQGLARMDQPAPVVSVARPGSR